MMASETTQMVAAARKSGRRLIEAFHYRYHPMFSRILEIVRTGQLGPLRSASALFEVPIQKSPGEIRWDMSLGGGALMDLGCYPVHWLRSIAGTEPQVRNALRETEDGVDVATSAELSFPGGMHGSLSCSMRPSSGQPMASLTLEGRDGRLTALNPLAPQFGHMLTWTSGGAAPVTETFGTRPTYDFQLDAVVTAIKTGGPVPTEGDDMIHTMTAIDAIARAAQGQQA
jgi:predicted dehydrogenase